MQITGNRIDWQRFPQRHIVEQAQCFARPTQYLHGQGVICPYCDKRLGVEAKNIVHVPSDFIARVVLQLVGSLLGR